MSDQNTKPTLIAIDFDPFADEPHSVAFPLTGPQQEVWAASQLSAQASVCYNLCFHLRLRGRLSVPALRSALQTVLQRHEALRMRVSRDGSEQSIQSCGDVLSEVDLRGLPPDRLGDEVQRILRHETAAPFDLTKAPLLRAQLIREADDCRSLVITVHHIACDGWSTGILFGELMEVYNADCYGLSPQLPAPASYRDYVRAELARAGDEQARRDEDYWAAQFVAGSPVLDLPLDRPRPGVKTYHGAYAARRIDADVYRRIKVVGAQRGCTLFVTLFTGFQALLSRLSGQQEFNVGIAIAGQGSLENGQLIAHAVNALPVRANMRHGDSFAENMKSVRLALLEAQTHSRVTFGSLLRRLHLPRDPSRTPLIDVTFNMDRSGEPLRFNELEMVTTDTPRSFVSFELGINVGDSGHDALIQCYYNTDLFDAETIERWLGHYVELLSAAASNPDLAVGLLNLLSYEDREHVVHVWNSTAKDVPLDVALPQMFEAQVERTPDAPAVVFQSQSLSYREINERANQLAHHLRTLGVGAEARIAICLDRSIEVIVAVLGVFKAGAAYVPLDPSYPAERLSFMLEDAQAQVLITQSVLAGVLPPHKVQTVRLDEQWPAIAQQPTRNLPAAPSSSLAYIIYTSGSTGRPKGVLVEHRGLSNLVLAQSAAFGLRPGRQVLQFASFSFDAAVSEIGMALTTGAALHLAPRDTLMSLDGLSQLILSKRIDVVTLPPSMLALLDPTRLPGLQTVISAGEACPWEIALRWSADRYFFNAYGPTETTIGPTFHRVQARVEGSRTVPIGRPIANMQLYILDAYGQPVPIGVSGEIYIGGVGVARGYLNRLELTAEKFLVRSFDGGSPTRLYRTGDVARFLPGGDIEYLGRVDQQVKLRGYRVELGEIEACLAKHPSVRDALVTVHTDRAEPLLAAYLIPIGERTGVHELREFMLKRVPPFMVPAAFVWMEAYPLSPNGKVDRKVLPPPDLAAEASRQPVSPRNPLEEALAEVWQEVLGCGPVGMLDGFFDLGGHSLLAMRMLTRIRESYGVEISLGVFLRKPYIEALAQAVEQSLVEEISRLDGDEVQQQINANKIQVSDGS